MHVIAQLSAVVQQSEDFLNIWIFGYLAIWLRAKTIPEWGIPEKSIKNVAQRR